jgi:hypothetical protein
MTAPRRKRAPKRDCARCGKPLSPERAAKRKRKCYLCEVAAKRDQRQAAHDRRITMNGFTAADYWRLYAAQESHCAVYGCRANGQTKFLAVEHDHKCVRGHDPKEWCRYCVRGLACSMHNGWLGKAHDDPRVFDSLGEYLRNPPAGKVLT